MRGCAFLSILLLAAPARSAELPQHRVSGDLTLQVRDIFQRYCSECHTGGDEPGKSRLVILDHKQVVAKNRPVPFLTPGGGKAQILELIKDGSMPPANKPGPTPDEIAVLEKWVKANAPAYPAAFDDRYTLSAMLDDFDRQRPIDGLFMRYVSFAHLIRDGQPLPNLAVAEERLREALCVASGKRVKLVAVDPSATLLRIDLRELGWHTRDLFEKVDRNKVVGIASIIPFDLLLLEYPHGFLLAPEDPFSERLGAFFKQAEHLRPVPFLRADWLTNSLLKGKQSTPLADDLRSLVELAEANDPPPGPVMRPFAGLKALTVPDSESGQRAVIAPLGSWYAGDVSSIRPPFKLNASLQSSGKSVHTIRVDEPFSPRVEADSRVFVTVLMVLADGEVRVQEIGGGYVLQPNTPRDLAPPGRNEFRITSILSGGDSATEYFVLLASEKEIPLPTIIRSKHAEGDDPKQNRRPVWRFLVEPPKGELRGSTQVVRRVIPIKLVKKQ
ncbi:MAG: hypothetical protein L0241_02465 [Planctomycetia bacterium]|nr:hypothetical protein [Planctomycetia bacterium]